MQSNAIDVHRFPMAGPDDVSGLAHVLERGDMRAADVIAVLGKTEGNGGVNDFTRGYATMAFAHLLSGYLDVPPEVVEERVAFVMSGGTEGVLTPHCTVFSRRQGGGDVDPAGVESKRLAVAVTFTRDFQPEELGRMAMIKETADAVTLAMESAGIDDPADVHFVQVKCPLLTNSRIEEARGRGQDVVTSETYKSMGYSRAASALGVALALGEIPAERITEEAVVADPSLYSGVASTSAGVELLHNAIILMGNSAGATGDLVIGHAVMDDAIDIRAVHEALHQVGIDAVGGLSDADAQRVVNVFAKAEADPTGRVRGQRHTMLTDTDISSTRHARAAVGALIAGVVGSPTIYVSGGAEHQGPAGGGPIAVIARAT